VAGGGGHGIEIRYLSLPCDLVLAVPRSFVTPPPLSRRSTLPKLQDTRELADSQGMVLVLSAFIRSENVRLKFASHPVHLLSPRAPVFFELMIRALSWEYVGNYGTEGAAESCECLGRGFARPNIVGVDLN
jgi:hypothetical protein